MIDTKIIENIPLKDGLFLKPEYLNHPTISGNKYRKLRYNIKEARAKGHDTILTFGGAFSNHIVATAAAGLAYDFKTIGVIRGHELGSMPSLNSSLEYAKKCGMHLEFVSRQDYKLKDTDDFLKHLHEKYGDFYCLPEGGTNALAIQGCEEILNEDDKTFDYVCCPVGTGGTISGIINSCSEDQTVLGFPALKGDFLSEEIQKHAKQTNWKLITEYHFGGYAKINSELISFINRFKTEYGIPLDPVYTGKMMYGIFDMIDKDLIPSTAKILAIHTGGLQGIKGMNDKLKKKNLPILI